MQKKVVFRHMDHSEVMEKYAHEQLEKIVRFLENEREPIYLDLILEPSKVHAHHRIEVRVKSPHYDLISNYEGSEFYDVLDRVIDVMYRQLCEKKRKLVDDKKTGNSDWYKGA